MDQLRARFALVSREFAAMMEVVRMRAKQDKAEHLKLCYCRLDLYLEKFVSTVSFSSIWRHEEESTLSHTRTHTHADSVFVPH